MSQISQILRDAADGVGGKYLLFRCPGCNKAHQIRYAGSGSVWGWNGDAVKPTFTPSVLVTGYNMSDEGYAMLDRGEKPPGGKYPGQEMRCHSFVADGRIQFLGDCTHALGNQTVDLPAWPEMEVGP